MQRTDRDNQIVAALAAKARLFSLGQIASTWWTDSRSPVPSARKRLTLLCDAGLLKRLTVYARPLLDLTGPLLIWRPGNPAPNFDALAWRLERRTPTVAPRQLTAYRTTPTANNQFGGPPRFKPLIHDQVWHDLHVSAVFLRFLKTDPEAAAAWVGEDVRGKEGHLLKDPDAVLEFRDGRPPVVIEFAGRYDARRLAEFHHDCVKRERSYQLW